MFLKIKTVNVPEDAGKLPKPAWLESVLADTPSPRVPGVWGKFA